MGHRYALRHVEKPKSGQRSSKTKLEHYDVCPSQMTCRHGVGDGPNFAGAFQRVRGSRPPDRVPTQRRPPGNDSPNCGRMGPLALKSAISHAGPEPPLRCQRGLLRSASMSPAVSNPNEVFVTRLRLTHRAATRIVAATAATLAAAGTILTAGTPAQAASRFDVYALRASNLHVNSNSCRNVHVTASTTAGSSVEDIWAEADVWHGNQQTDSVWLEPVHGNVNRLAGNFYYCPSLDGVGQFRLGSTAVDWYDGDYNDRSFADNSTGKMVIKQATRARFTASRSGARRTFRAHAVYFGVGYGWIHFPKGVRVTLQRRPAKSSGPWKSVQSQRTTKSGNVTYTIRASKTHQYRVVSAATTRSWNLAGPVLTK